MPIYLGSTEVLATVADPDKGIYLGDQRICSTFLGSSQTLDNCAYTPVVVTLNVNTGQITGSGYTVGGANTGSSQSGQAGVDTYSFTTTIQADVLVVGGTASGISAGIQSARLGVNTIIVENTTWQEVC